jgi:3-hydroxy-9,10-secoandrosta-1,3,5(10)-triene-9,17-dione monooxygenase reductase component
MSPVLQSPEPATTVASPDLRRLMRRWPAGVAVVTSTQWQGRDQAEAARVPSGCTVNTFISVSLRPPLILVSLSGHSRTLAAIVDYRAFGVNVLAEQQFRLADHFASAAGDRFAGVPYQWEAGVPVLDGTAAAVGCTVEQIMAGGDHALVLGSPWWCRQDDDAHPIVSYDGSYRLLAGSP